MARIVVVGGGISGLAAAQALSDLGSVVLLDASPRFGGKIAAVELDGVRLDVGAEAVLARRPEATDLIGDLGLPIAHPTQARAGLLVGGRRVTMPPSRQGIPTDVTALGELLSPAGLVRAAAEPELAAPPLAGDVGIGAYVSERFGSEVADRLLEPLLGGVYAGRSRDLSFAAVNPSLFEQARTGGSLLRHAQQRTGSSAGAATDRPVFAGLVGGVQGLVDALVDDLTARGVELRTGATVRGLHAVGRSVFELTVGSTTAEQRIRADAVVLAIPAAPAGRLLSGLNGRVGSAGVWAAIPYASMAVVTVVVRDVEPEGSGLLVPPGELPTIKAATYSSNKWAWIGDAAAGTWGPEAQVARFSVGRLGEEALLHLDDAALLARTFDEATASIPGWSRAALVRGQVTRWGGGLPQYLVGHRELVSGLRRDLDQVPGLAVAGAALDGLGIAPCIATARLAAAKIRHDLED